MFMISNIKNPGVIQESDWNKVRQIFKTIQKKITDGDWDHKKIVDPIMGVDVYSIGKFGSLSIGSLEDNTLWYFWTGTMLEKLLPWANIVKKQMVLANLPITNITYHCHTGSTRPHRDTAYFGEFSDQPHTNINFVISSVTPDESYTWCRDDNDNEMRYYSHPNKLWILNTSNVHSVVSNGFREGLIIKLRQPFDKVNNFFKNNPNFFDANQHYFN